MRLLLGLSLGLALVTASACGPDTVVPVQLPGLDLPAPPPHVVVPAPPDPDPPTVATPPAPSPVVTPSTTRTSAPRTDRSDPPAARPATEEPPAQPPAPAVLQTTADASAAERKVRDTLQNATRDLGRVAFTSLSDNAKAQYATAQSFIRQADNALKAHRIAYAGQLADKAAAMAALLVRGD